MSLLGAIKTCLASTLRWQCVTSTSSRMLSLLNNNDDSSDLILWRQLKPRFRNSSNVASFKRNITQTIEAEVQKLIECGFVWEEQHSDWVGNIVPIPKKNGKICVCIDFRDLNIACPKDEFLLPITDVMIDNMCGFERMSFMDGFSGYNQIKMYPDDEKHTSFRTPLGMFCYTVMSFG